MMKVSLALVAVSVAFAQQAPSREDLLRGRVSEFWKAFEEKKYRKADALVLEEDKDDFFSWSKKQIFAQQKTDIKFSEDGKMAEVMTSVDTDEFMVGVGSMRITRPVLTYWKFQDDNWWWFAPKNMVRDSPFGKWITGGQRDAANPNTSITAMMAKGPNIEDLWKKVMPSKTELSFKASAKGEDSIEFKNELPGDVSLILDIPPREEFEVSVDPKVVPRSGTGVVTVKFTPAAPGTRVPFQPGVYDLRVTVAQTGKTHTIKLKVD
jgi:hypothetical protein